MTSLQHSIIGLPGSGKTTFLAALWHLLDAGEVSSKFVLDKLVGDHTHLNMIVDAWRRCEEVPRTSMAAEAKVSIHVREAATGRTAVLNFPDLSGESFERQLSTRLCTTEYVEGFEGPGGVLLFVTADRSSDGMAILDVSSLESGEVVVEQIEEHREWTPEMVSMQVNLVELLQFLQHLPFRRGVRRIAVVISAWDVVETPSLEPTHWLERELPLLYQFLISNPRSFEFRVFGVSAQGGDVKSDRKSELVMKTPSTRISCIGPETDPHDLTSPIVWLMAGD
jgi:adenylate kinase family enzyme